MFECYVKWFEREFERNDSKSVFDFFCEWFGVERCVVVKDFRDWDDYGFYKDDF